jgi:hypothetical protein
MERREIELKKHYFVWTASSASRNSKMDAYTTDAHIHPSTKICGVYMADRYAYITPACYACAFNTFGLYCTGVQVSRRHFWRVATLAEVTSQVSARRREKMA